MGPRSGMAQIPAARLPFGKSIVVPGGHQLAEHDRLGRDQRVLRRLRRGRRSPAAHAVPGRALLVIVLARPRLSIVGYEAIHTFEQYAAVVLGDPLRDRHGRPAAQGRLRAGRRLAARPIGTFILDDDDRRQLQPRLGPVRLGLQALPARRDVHRGGSSPGRSSACSSAPRGSRSSASPWSARSATRRTRSTRSTPCSAAAWSAPSR